MNVNVGKVDRGIRFIGGFALIVAAWFSGLEIFNSGMIQWIATIAGVVFVATSLMRFCPLYRIFGIRTCRL